MLLDSSWIYYLLFLIISQACTLIAFAQVIFSSDVIFCICSLAYYLRVHLLQEIAKPLNTINIPLFHCSLCHTSRTFILFFSFFSSLHKIQFHLKSPTSLPEANAVGVVPSESCSHPSHYPLSAVEAVTS